MGLVSETAAKIAYERDMTEDAWRLSKGWFITSHDPDLLHDMDKAVARISSVIENYEQNL